MPWRASSSTASSPTSACPSPTPTAGRAERSSTYSEDRIAIRETSSVGARRCRGRDDYGTCPCGAGQSGFTKTLECGACRRLIYKLQREVLEIRRYLTG